MVGFTCDGVGSTCNGAAQDDYIPNIGSIGKRGRMNLEEQVIEIIIEQLDVAREQCVPEASFVNDLGADSLDLMELIMEMEEQFDVSISDEELQKIRTIQNVIDFLRANGAA